MSNTGEVLDRGKLTTQHAAWSAFDALPKPYRKLLTQAALKFSTEEVLDFYTQGYSSSLIELRLKTASNRFHKQLYGPAYPDQETICR